MSNYLRIYSESGMGRSPRGGISMVAISSSRSRSIHPLDFPRRCSSAQALIAGMCPPDRKVERRLAVKAGPRYSTMASCPDSPSPSKREARARRFCERARWIDILRLHTMGERHLTVGEGITLHLFGNRRLVMQRDLHISEFPAQSDARQRYV